MKYRVKKVFLGCFLFYFIAISAQTSERVMRLDELFSLA